MKKTIKFLSFVLCMAMLFTACGAKAPLSKEQAVKFADRDVLCLVNKDYEAVTGGFNESIAKQVDATALQQAWESVVSTAGGFISATGINYESKDGLAIVTTTAEFENTAIIITLTYDNSGKIRGIWFNYAPEDSIYQPIDTDAFTEKVALIGEYELKAVVTTPDNTADYPVVVLVQGSGASDFDETVGANKPFKELAHGLAQKGIASVRINKRLYQKPVLMHDQLTIWDEYMDDIYAAIDYAKANVSENVYVIGHSQGGMSAPKIALDNDLKGVVMMAGTIRGLEDIVLDQNTAALEAMDQYSKKEKQQILKATQDGVAAVKALTEESTEPVLGIPAQYWLSLRDLDAENILKNKLDIPVLVLQGTADFQVYMDKDFEHMKSVLGQKENISFKAYDGLNHLFMPQSLPGVADISEYNAENHIPQYVIDDIAEFIDDNSLSYYDNGEFVCRINNVAKTIEKNFPIRMSTPIDDEYMRFIDISAELYEAYAGYYCPITPGVETILVIEAKEGKVEEIKTKLQQRKDNIVAAYVNYTNDWKDKAKAGRIIVKGNYIALIIAGDEAVIEEKGVDVAYSYIDELLKKIFDK